MPVSSSSLSICPSPPSSICFKSLIIGRKRKNYCNATALQNPDNISSFSFPVFLSHVPSPIAFLTVKEAGPFQPKNPIRQFLQRFQISSRLYNPFIPPSLSSLAFAEPKL
jgi:hypothetical protein